MKILQRIGLYIAVAMVAFFALFPFYWALNTSFKTEDEMFQRATYLPRNPTIENYQYVFRDSTFTDALRNSVVVSGATTFLALTTGSFAAYALGRLRFRGRTVLLYEIGRAHV